MAADTNPTPKKTLKCTINGVAVEVTEGTSIIEAMQANQQAIAHYCWHPGLSVAGVCRLCVVEIQGNPRPQIACNTMVTDGMVVNNTSDKVKDAVKWGLDFHLINHPLDCPICDQAGECGLQDQYMAYGKYDPEMHEAKVKKHKVQDIGPRVVLDSERCILCSRCVRFTDEVSKTHELGIFNRGDRAEIGIVEGRKLDNNYSMNTVDICPVGALTSKDFRFRQRVWFLKEADSICTGCSTGCNVKVHYNREGIFRIKPKFNAEINSYWMCDVGRDSYKFLNREYRLLDAQVNRDGRSEYILPETLARKVGESLRTAGGAVALVLTGQHSNEEYEAIIGLFQKDLGSTRIYHWVNNPEEMEKFDGLLYRGDKNPNTRGLQGVMKKFGVSTDMKQLATDIASGAIQTVVVAGPENQSVFPDMPTRLNEWTRARNLVWLTACKNELLERAANITLIPLKTYFEKQGTYVNFKGIAQTVKPGAVTVPNALSLEQVANLFAGRELDTRDIELDTYLLHTGAVRNEAEMVRGAL